MDQALRQVIHKQRAGGVPPNMADYERDARGRSPGRRRARELDGLPGGGLNIAHEAVDRHAGGPLAATRRAALPRQARRACASSPTPSCAARPNRFANVLRALGVAARRARVRARRPDPRALHRGARHAEARQRVLPAVLGVRPGADPSSGCELGDAPGAGHHASALPPQGRRAARRAARARRTCCWSATEAAIAAIPGRRDLRALMRSGRRALRDRARPTPEDMALLHFTSGTTGTPKGAVHVHEAVVAHYVTGTYRARPARRTTSSGARPTRAG